MTDITSGNADIDSDVKLLADDPDPVAPPVEDGEEEEINEEPSDESDEEPEEENTDDEEEPEQDDEKEEQENEEVDDATRVSLRDLKAKYPDIFKQFPDLRRALAHENEYSKIYPSPEDAKKSKMVVDAFYELGDKCMEGDPKFILEKIQGQDKEAFDKYVENFLPSVFALNPVTFSKITRPIINKILRHARDTGQQNNDKNLYYSAAYIARHLYGESKVPDDDMPQEDPRMKQREEELREKERAINQRLQDNFTRSVITDGNNRIMSIIRRNMDPENAMSPKMRDAAAKEIYGEIDRILASDPRHRNTMNSLINQAEKEEFSQAAKDKILNALLARVKPLLPSVRQKVIQEYLGQKPKTGKPKADKKFIPSSGSTGRDRNTVLDPKKIDYKGLTDSQILDDNFVPKLKK